jgi:hypothetical protein
VQSHKKLLNKGGWWGWYQWRIKDGAHRCIYCRDHFI